MQVLAAPQMAASEVAERLRYFAEDVFANSLLLPSQRRNGLLYLRGVIEDGGRKSLQPTLFRLGEDRACYESMQQFLADSPWSADALLEACARRVLPELDVQAWIVDDTGVKKDGQHSPGVKRQWSGTLGKIDNCQLTVSLHAAGRRGTQPLGWRLYLPQEWCEHAPRRAKAKIPAELDFRTKPELAGDLIELAAGWGLQRAPILADCAYGEDTDFRSRLQALGLEYLVAVAPTTTVYGPETRFFLPKRAAPRGRPPSVPRPDRKQESLRALALRLPEEAWQTLPCRTTPAGEPLCSRFALVRVVAAHPVRRQRARPRWEWLIIAWPPEAEEPSDYWLSNLPEQTEPERLARLARLRWTIELDYRQLKGELGLDHYEGRSYRGFHHHCALVSVAHGFLTLERLCPKAARPA